MSPQASTILLSRCSSSASTTTRYPELRFAICTFLIYPCACSRAARRGSTWATLWRRSRPTLLVLLVYLDFTLPTHGTPHRRRPSTTRTHGASRTSLISALATSLPSTTSRPSATSTPSRSASPYEPRCVDLIPTNQFAHLVWVQVLKKNPEYPKIQKDVLEKARAGLRT